jgi:hypothetical protein
MLRGILVVVASLRSLATGDEPSAPELQWSAPPGCPDAEHVARRVAAYSGSRPRRGSVQVTHTGEEFVAEIVLEHDGASQRRSISAQSCDALAEAVALVIALDPERGHIDPPPSDPPPQPVIDEPPPPRVPDRDPAVPAAPRTPPSTPAPERQPPAEATPTRTRASGLRIGLGVGGGITYGLVPSIGPTISGSIAVIGKRWRAEAAGIATIPTHAGLRDGDYVLTADVGSGIAVLRGAWLPPLGPVELPLFAGLDIGALRARGHGGNHPQSQIAPLVALEGGVGIGYAPLPWLAIGVQAAAVFALARPRFAVHAGTAAAPQDDVVFRSKAVGVRATGGLEFRVPAAPRRGR